MIIDRLKAYANSMPENTHPKSEFRMSSAGDCPRKLDYEFQLGAKPIDSKSYFRMSLGHASHNFLRDLLSNCLGSDFHSAEEEIKAILPSGQVITGHPDGRIESLNTTLEIKSVSDSTFTMIQNDNKPIDAHIDQANMYAAVQRDENVLILYANRDSGEMTEFMFPTSPELFARSFEKFKSVEENKKAGVIRPRPYSNAQESPCWFCPWKDKCYEGFEKEVSQFKTEVFDGERNQLIVNTSIAAIKYRTDRLVASKLEEEAKQYVGKFLYDSQINKAEIRHANGIIDVNISVGKNNNLLPNLKERKANGK